MLTNMTRRDILKASAAFGAFNIIPAKVLFGATAPSNQLTRAIIGFGGIARSGNHLGFKGSRLVGLCDPDALHVQAGLSESRQAGWGAVKAYRDFLAVLDDPGVDIVHICTPPHWHGCMSVMAARTGKDIWCEKPMTRTLGEGKRVMEYVKAKGRMFRLNTWFRYQNPFYGLGSPVKPLYQLRAAGFLGDGPVRCVLGPGQGFDWKLDHSGRVNLAPEPVPSTFDWEMWLGPAPWKPYNRHRTHETFRGYWDYNGGGLADMSQHYFDAIQYLLGKDETSPVRIDYQGPRQHPELVGRFDRITCTYADGTEIVLDGNRSLMDEPFMTGANGATVWPAPDKDGKITTWTSPGDDRLFRMKDGHGNSLDVARLLSDLPEPPAQQTDFMDSVRTRRRFCLNEETGFRSCTLTNLSIVAQRLGRGFDFDPVTLRAKNDVSADRYLYQAMREPWEREFMKG